MPDLVLSAPQQRALRSVLATEPVPGNPLPHPRLLENLAALIPCDSMAVEVTDLHGYPIDAVDWPRGHPVDVRPVADALVLRVRNGVDLVVQLEMDRHDRPFTARDLSLLRLLEPACARLFSERPAPHLPSALTAQERRVLRLVASGRSNSEIAERMGIATSTVRKHLEHVFPKLGVSNRLAAAATFEGRALPDPGQVAPAQRYA